MYDQQAKTTDNYVTHHKVIEGKTVSSPSVGFLAPVHRAHWLKPGRI